MQATTNSARLFAFDNSYARLPERFYARLDPTPVAAPRLIRVNAALARQLGLDPEVLASPDGVEMLAGNRVPASADPIATAYAGHQFGGFSAQLGDGRAILLGEIIDHAGNRRDIQLKGSGPTPFSRSGDGRAALGPVLREYIVSEAMAALAIPTTRALAAVASGETVRRETALPGAILTRVAASHIRVGTFQFFAARQDVEALRLLADHVIARHYPAAADTANPYRALLDQIIARQSDLVAAWMGAGFIHGVMNTDNMSIAGETIDYGPCAFMDTFDPATVYSSIDRGGRYAYGNQPRLARWNLARLAEAMLPILGPDEDAALREAQAAIDVIPALHEASMAAVFRRKLGLATTAPDDLALAQDLLEIMTAAQADFTLTFRALSAGAVPTGEAPLRSRLAAEPRFDDWLARWRGRLAAEGTDAARAEVVMRAANPAFIARNHLVEEAISAGVNDNDFAPFEALIGVLARPFEDQPDAARYAAPPRPDEVVHQTFCGT